MTIDLRRARNAALFCAAALAVTCAMAQPGAAASATANAAPGEATAAPANINNIANNYALGIRHGHAGRAAANPRHSARPAAKDVLAVNANGTGLSGVGPRKGIAEQTSK
jgi:hypothetical protein